jgi:predicted Fe-Mo cluster-binding NifX family protein
MEQKIAVPVSNGVLGTHFGHCPIFFIADVVDGEITKTSEEVPPPHEPGVIPRWLSEKGVNVVLVGGIGQKAVSLFQNFGVKPVIGVPVKQPEQLIKEFIAGELETGVNQCSH